MAARLRHDGNVIPSLDLALTALALGLEAACGFPDALFRAIRHPVVWMGALIGLLDARFNHGGARRLRGVIALVVVLIAAAAPAWALQRVLAWPLLGVIGSSLLASRSLHAHVRAVEVGLRRDGVAGGRAAVAHIVGRNPAALDAAGVARAAIESLAENFSDGVVAPALWGALLGLPGMAGYKAANTADSMIGHRSERHLLFGWAAARFDDVVNLPASRLAALWLIIAAALSRDASARGAIAAVRRDARNHRSPNAGWPEAAMAGALRLRLNGPRVYGSTLVNDAWMGDGRAEAGPDDIAAACRLYRRACALQIAAVVAAALIARA
jgi:adenosylcobinamide-phosphate synthase